MSAAVKPNPFGSGWVGSCKECKETIAGHAATVDLWADIHNENNHEEEKDNG